MKIKQPIPIFIVGNGRSGTTMLGEILTKADVGRSFEGHFVTKALKKFGFSRLSNESIKDLVTLIESYESSKLFSVNLDKNKYYESNGVVAKDIIVDALEMIAAGHRRKQWIEKTPNYIYDLSLILTAFPRAKIIFMLRDGRDVANSVLQKSWGANNIYYAGLSWKTANYPKTVLSDKRVLLVKYEELLTNPERGLKNIDDFLDIECERLDKYVASINKQKMNRWRQTLSDRQIRTFEAVAFDCLKHYGYETQSQSKPRLYWYEKRFYDIHHYYKLALHLFKQNITRHLAIKFGLKLPFNDKN
jgi:hypothetical protein